jgi:hypothetical protein
VAEAEPTSPQLGAATSNELVRQLRAVSDADLGEPPGPLGWPHVVVVGRARDRPIARFVVGASGMILGASTGMFVGGMIGVILAMALLPLLPEIAVGLLVVTTLTCGSAGAVVGSRVLQRETFDEVV